MTNESETENEPKGNQVDVIKSEAPRIRVNAGAGTGKTSTMVWKVKHEIEQNDANPERILTLTFANKAAHNIEAKVAEKLDTLSGYNVSAYTYHSFAHRLLKDYAYYTDHPPDFELITGQRRSNILPEVLRRTDFELVNPMNPGGNGIQDRVLSDISGFITDVKAAGYEPKELQDALPARSDLQRAQRTVREILRVATTLRDFNTLFADGTDSKQLLLQWLMDLRDVLEREQEELSGQSDFLDEIAAYLGQMQMVFAQVVVRVRSNDMPPYAWTLPFSLFTDNWSNRRFESFDQNLFTRLSGYVEAYRRAYDFTRAYEAYEKLLNERKALDYDDLISSAVELLKDEDVGPGIVSEWDYVYCDEFQDTHHAELEIVQALAEETELLIIGDTDQAIYEWRGADPKNLANVTDIFSDIESIDLNLNFRSYQGILDFTANLGHTDPLKANRGRNQNEVIRIEGYQDKDAQASQVATAVSRLIRGRFDDIDAYDNDEIAVIVRKNSQAELVAEKLDEESIPFSLSTTGSSKQSPGVETILSYFRFLVDPSDAISLSRVLLHLYGLPREDLTRLHQEPHALHAALKTVPHTGLQKPEAVSRAVDDITKLQTVRKTNSLSGFYEQFREITKIEWYLSAEERSDLAALERQIEGYDDDAVQSMLTKEFMDYLDLQNTIAQETIDARIQTADKVENKVNVLTVHRAKGLDFDVVMLPFLSDSEWLSSAVSHPESVFSYDVVLEAADGNHRQTWLQDDLGDVDEQWRILHVAITRAKDHLFFFGHERSAISDSEQPPIGEIDALLPDEIEWSFRGQRMDIWTALDNSYERLKESHPESVIDLTDVVNEGMDETRENITYYGNQIEPGEAEAKVLEFADQLRRGTISPVDPKTFDLQAIPGQTDRTVSLAREHSHSSLETFQGCPRRHYLDHVVYAYPDQPMKPASTESTTEDNINYAGVGTLFHDVAEEAYWREYETEDDWARALERLGARTDLSPTARDLAREAVARFFKTDVSEWEQLAAEWPFMLDSYLPGLSGHVKGFVDGVFRKPSGELVVLDYKTTKGKKSIDESYQLLLYLEALNERLEDTSVETAGYVYVGEAGPAVELYDRTELVAYRDALNDDLRGADQSRYTDPDAGMICSDCLHYSLGCADPAYLPSG